MRLQALKKIEKDKLQVARAYSKKVRGKSFHVGVLVGRQFYWDKEQQIWQVVAKLGGTVQNRQGYLRQFLCGGDDARALPKALDPRYLKKYYPSSWQSA